MEGKEKRRRLVEGKEKNEEDWWKEKEVKKWKNVAGKNEHVAVSEFVFVMYLCTFSSSLLSRFFVRLQPS